MPFLFLLVAGVSFVIAVNTLIENSPPRQQQRDRFDVEQELLTRMTLLSMLEPRREPCPYPDPISKMFWSRGHRPGVCPRCSR
jgi:hypothetical protein